jgi:hypothetical protein
VDYFAFMLENLANSALHRVQGRTGMPGVTRPVDHASKEKRVVERQLRGFHVVIHESINQSINQSMMESKEAGIDLRLFVEEKRQFKRTAEAVTMSRLAINLRKFSSYLTPRSESPILGLGSRN